MQRLQAGKGTAQQPGHSADLQAHFKRAWAIPLAGSRGCFFRRVLRFLGPGLLSSGLCASLDLLTSDPDVWVSRGHCRKKQRGEENAGRSGGNSMGMACVVLLAGFMPSVCGTVLFITY